jgi:hypothetical protein
MPAHRAEVFYPAMRRVPNLPAQIDILFLEVILAFAAT